MKLLLDTHLLLWAATTPEHLSPQARQLIESADNELLFSAASLWEVAIKARLASPPDRRRPGGAIPRAGAQGLRRSAQPVFRNPAATPLIEM